MLNIHTSSLGNAWIEIMKTIMNNGTDTVYTDNYPDELPVKECLGITITVDSPKWPDALIEKYLNPAEFNWMKDNFQKLGTVEALYDHDSYATRLYDYMHVKNQVQWVINRLKEEPRLRSATITTFEPLKDEKYIPCVSMIDFNVENGKLACYVYCRALDFGTKAYANLVMLHLLQKEVANALQMECEHLTLFVKSAHCYVRNFERINEILESV